MQRIRNLIMGSTSLPIEDSQKTAMLPIRVATYQATNSLRLEYQALLPSANIISQKLMQFLTMNHNLLKTNNLIH